MFIRNAMSNSVVVRKLDTSENEVLRQHYEGKMEFSRFGTEGQLLTAKYSECADSVRNMRLRSDDIFIQMYTRSGTIITQEIVWLLMNNLDYETAAKSYSSDRYHSLERASLIPVEYVGELPDEIKSPRLFKTHLSWELIPSTILEICRVIHVARDPREAAVAFYNTQRDNNSGIFKLYPYCGDFKSYWQLFINDLTLFTPYFSIVKPAWKQRKNPNMLFLFYDEFLKDLLSVVKRIAKFLGKEYSEADYKKLAEHVAQYLEPYYPVSLQDSDNSKYEGKEGRWFEHFDEEMRKQAEEWMQHHLADTDLKFPST